MKLLYRPSLSCLIAAVLCTAASAQPNSATSKRVIYYYQTQYSNGKYVSLAPLYARRNLNVNGQPFTTDVLVGAFHLGPETDGSKMHLNNDPPSSPIYNTMYKEIKRLQAKGTNVEMFLGGAGDGSFGDLAQDFNLWYPVLKRTLVKYGFNGVNLDVEDAAETTDEIEVLIDQLRTDFGPSFLISLAPTATKLYYPLEDQTSAIDYYKLYLDEGSKIDYLAAQFYNGFGGLNVSDEYLAATGPRQGGNGIFGSGGFPAHMVVAGMLSNPANGEAGVDVTLAQNTVRYLLAAHPDFGGVAAFEYFNSEPAGAANPAVWGTYFALTMGAKAVSSTTPVVAIDAGGPAVQTYLADQDYNGGSIFSTTQSISTAGIGNLAPERIYQSQRLGEFTYTVTGLAPGSVHEVRLHFAELTATGAGQRLFNVSLNRAQMLNDFDVYATALSGQPRFVTPPSVGNLTAIIEPFTTVADAAGQIAISFTAGDAGEPILNGLEVQ